MARGNEHRVLRVRHQVMANGILGQIDFALWLFANRIFLPRPVRLKLEGLVERVFGLAVSDRQLVVCSQRLTLQRPEVISGPASTILVNKPQQPALPLVIL